MKISFLGAGNVGGPLANQLQQGGHTVVLANDGELSEKKRALLAKNPGLLVDGTEGALANSDVVFLAVPFMVIDEMLPPLKGHLAGKVLVDCTNPVGPGLSHSLSSQQSGTQKIAELLPETHVVKSFSIYGFENLSAPPASKNGLKPMMPFCGDDASAKARVSDVIAQLGWEPLDVGGLAQALHLEHMTLLWIRMVRVQGASVHTLWAHLTGGD